MDTYEQGRKLLLALEENLDQGSLEPDADGTVEVDIAGWPTSLHLVEETEELLLLTPLGMLPSDQRRPGLVRELMQANYAGVGTAGGTIGKDPDSDVIYLFHRFEFFTAPPDFIEKLNRLLGFACYWREKLQELPVEPAWEQSPHTLRV
jgi:hypothetical protein